MAGRRGDVRSSMILHTGGQDSAVGAGGDDPMLCVLHSNKDTGKCIPRSLDCKSFVSCLSWRGKYS